MEGILCQLLDKPTLPCQAKMGLDVEDLHAGYPTYKQPTQCHTGHHTKNNDLWRVCLVININIISVTIAAYQTNLQVLSEWSCKTCH